MRRTTAAPPVRGLPARRSPFTLLALLALLVGGLVAGCGTEESSGGSASDSASASASASGSASSSSPKKGPRWAYEDVAGGGQGKFTDVVAPAADDIWATAGYEENGTSTAAQQHLFHYDGHHWQRREMPPELDGGVFNARLGTSGTDGPGTSGSSENVWLVGSPDSDRGAAHIVRWDGTRWQRIPSGPEGIVADLEVLGPDDVWVLAGGKAEHWDGKRWRTVPMPAQAEDLDGTSGDDLWAVGRRDSGSGVDRDQLSQPAAMHWDGRGWKLAGLPAFRFPDPQPAEAEAGLKRVVAISRDKVFAYGQLSFNHGETEDEPDDKSLALRWNGSRWSEEKGPSAGCTGGQDPVQDGHGGLIYLNRLHFTADGECRRTTWSKLPSTGGITEHARQSLWFERIAPIPGTRKVIGAGLMQVNQSGNPMNKPLLATLKL
ncbi:hypothetical protein [Streptomyces axinellae]|uniref:Secreted protein n=1 Tax=Streptomyces axinellae TaxID=552788 RepID=A0ABN3PV23_9ACTN